MSQEAYHVRCLAWRACHNARDVGGYPALNGGRTRWKVLVRADNLQRLTPEGQTALCNYGVRTIIDLRSPHELERHANPFAAQQGVAGAPRYLNLALVDYDDREFVAAMAAAKSMLSEYCIILERSKHRIAEVIEAVAAGMEEGGVLVHCHGGKDRTGIIVALLLSLAGIPRETIVEDYALSETLLEPSYSAWLQEQSQAQGGSMERPAWMYTPPETMHGVFDYLDRAYGGEEGYLEAAGVPPICMEQVCKSLVSPVGDAGS